MNNNYPIFTSVFSLFFALFFTKISHAQDLQIDLSTTPADNCLPTGTATATATGGTGNYTYLWNTNATTTTIDNLASGVYSVVVDDGTSTVTDSVFLGDWTGPMTYDSTLWGNPTFNYITQVRQTSDGGFLVTGGNVVSTPNMTFVVATLSRLAPDGSVMWLQNGSSGSFYDACELSSGKLLATTGSKLQTYDGAGNYLSETTPFGSNFSSDYSFSKIMPLPLENYIVAGVSTGDEFGANVGGKDLWVSQVDGLQDTVVWAKNFGGNDDEIVLDMEQFSNGDVLILVESESTTGVFDEHLGLGDYWLIRIDKTGELLWKKHFGGSSSEVRYDLAINELDEIIFLVYTRSTDGDFVNPDNQQGMWFFKMDEHGTPIWTKNQFTNGNISSYQPNGIRWGKDGKIIHAYRTCNTCPLILTQLHSNGVTEWQQEFPNFAFFISAPYLQPDESILGIGSGYDLLSSIQFNAPQQPYVGIPNSITICENESLDFDLTDNTCNGCTYAWSTGETTPEITLSPTETTTYAVTLTDATGCSDSQDFTIVVQENPQITPFADTTFSCPQETIVLDAMPANCNNCVYAWNDGLTASTRTEQLLQDTSFSVTVTNEQGCISEESLNISIANDLDFTIQNTSKCDADNMIGWVNITGGSGNYTTTWSNGFVGDTIQNIPTGSYLATVTDGNCDLEMETEFLLERKVFVQKATPTPEGYTAAGMIQLSSNEFLISGFTDEVSAIFPDNYGSEDGVLVKMNEQYDILWARRFGGSGYDQLYHVVEMDNGDFIALGRTRSFDIDVLDNPNDSFQGWLIRVNTEGDLLWSKSYGGSASDNFNELKLLSDGTILATGYSFSDDGDLPENKGNADVWVCKIDGNGDLLWSKSYGGSEHDYNTDILELPDGNVLISAYTKSVDGDVSNNFGNEDIWLLKLDTDGNLLIDHSFGGSNGDRNGQLKLLPNGHILCAARALSTDIPLDIPWPGNVGDWVFTFDENFEIIWSKRFADYQYTSWMHEFQDGLLMKGSRTIYPGPHEVFTLQTIDFEGNLIGFQQFNGGAGNFVSLADDRFLAITSEPTIDEFDPNQSTAYVPSVRQITEFSPPTAPSDLLLEIADTLCEGTVLDLTVDLSQCPDCDILWNNGATTSENTVTASDIGVINVQLTDDNGCMVSDEIRLNIHRFDYELLVNDATCGSADGSATINADASVTAVWSNGSNALEINDLDLGSYAVSVTDGTCDASENFDISLTEKPKEMWTWLENNAPTTGEIIRDAIVKSDGSILTASGKGLRHFTSEDGTMILHPDLQSVTYFFQLDDGTFWGIEEGGTWLNFTENGTIISSHSAPNLAGESFFAIEKNPLGGFYIGGWIATDENTFPPRDILVLKINATGDLEWSKTFGGSKTDQLRQIQVLDNGNVVVGANSRSLDGDLSASPLSAKLWFFELNQVGEMLWSKILPSRFGDPLGFLIDRDDHLIVYHQQPYAGANDLYEIQKFEPNGGDFLWSKQVPASFIDKTAMTIIQDANDDYLFACDYFLYAYSNQGEPLWRQPLPMNQTHVILQKPNLDYYVIGYRRYAFSSPVGGQIYYDPYVISLAASPQIPNLQLPNDTLICQNEILPINTQNPNLTHLWNTGDTTTQILITSPGIYSVEVSSSSACVVMDSILVSTCSLVDLPDTLVACNVAIVNAAQPNIASYQWSNGATTPEISVTETGWIFVEMTTDLNEILNDSIFIQINDNNLVINELISNNNCYDEANGSIQITVPDAPDNLQFLWNNGATTANLTDLTVGSYEVTISQGQNCQQTAVFDITQPDPITFDVEKMNNSCFQTNDASLAVFPTGGTGDYQFLWSNGGTSASISNLPIGDYQVTITDDAACTQTALFSIIEPDSFLITLAHSKSPSCFGDEDGEMRVLVFGYPSGSIDYLWSTGDTLHEIENIAAGDYSVTVTHTNGCTETETFTLTQPDELQVNFTVFEPTPNDQNGSILVAPTGGTPSYNYVWADGTTENILTDLWPGNYVVTVTDFYDCIAVDSVELLTNDFDYVDPPMFLQIFPNPVVDVLNIDLKHLKTKELEVILYDVVGREVLPIFYKNDLAAADILIKTAVGKLPAGVYFLKIRNGEEEVVRRIFKRKTEGLFLK